MGVVGSGFFIRIASQAKEAVARVLKRIELNFVAESVIVAKCEMLDVKLNLTVAVI